jgi:hypothetical protein
MAAGPPDVFNISASIEYTYSTTSGAVTVELCVDGDTAHPIATLVLPQNASTALYNHTFFSTVTGLTAGAHTIQFYVSWSGSTGVATVLQSGTYGLCQRVF